MTLAAVIERELDRLAAAHESPEAFEALFYCLWSAGEPGHRQHDGDQGNANEPVQHGIDPS